MKWRKISNHLFKTSFKDMKTLRGKVLTTKFLVRNIKIRVNVGDRIKAKWIKIKTNFQGISELEKDSMRSY